MAKTYSIITNCNDRFLVEVLVDAMTNPDEDIRITFDTYTVGLRMLILNSNHIQKFKMLPNIDDVLIRHPNILLVLSISQRQIAEFSSESNLLSISDPSFSVDIA